MNMFGRIYTNWLVMGLFLGIALTASQAEAAQQGQAVVQAIRGTAEFATAGGAWAPVKVGTILYSGSTIKTGADSEVDINLKENGPLVRVLPNTTLGIDKLIFDKTGADLVTETQLDLKAGRIQGDIRKTSSASRFEVKTPTGVAGIRGSLIDIAANGVCKVKKGSLVVVYVDPSGAVSTHVVNGGFKFVPGVGVVPLTKEELDEFTVNSTPFRRAVFIDHGPNNRISPTSPTGGESNNE